MNVLPASFPSEPATMPRLPVHPWSAWPSFRVRTERNARRIGASCTRCREFGGEWRVVVSDTAKPNRPNQRVLHMGQNLILRKASGIFIYLRA